MSIVNYYLQKPSPKDIIKIIYNISTYDIGSYQDTNSQVKIGLWTQRRRIKDKIIGREYYIA